MWEGQKGPEGPKGPEGRRGRKWVHISTQHGHFDEHEKDKHEWEDLGERRLKRVPRGRLLFLIHVCKIVLTLEKSRCLPATRCCNTLQHTHYGRGCFNFVTGDYLPSLK